MTRRRRPPAATEERSRFPRRIWSPAAASGCAASGSGRPSPGPSTAAGGPGGSVPPVDHHRRDGRSRPWTRRVLEISCGTGWGRGERQPFVERTELPGLCRPVAGHRPTPRLIDASATATGAWEGPCGGGGCLEDAATFWPRGQEGRARRPTGGGSRSRTSRPWPLLCHAGPSQPWPTLPRTGWAVLTVDAARRQGRLRDGVGAQRAPARREAPGKPPGRAVQTAGDATLPRPVVG